MLLFYIFDPYVTEIVPTLYKLIFENRRPSMFLKDSDSKTDLLPINSIYCGMLRQLILICNPHF